MVKYKFFSKQDSNEESIMEIKTTDYEHALEIFTAMKQLSKKDFLDIYSIKQCDLNDR